MDKIQCSWNGKVHGPPKIEHCVVNKSTCVLHAFYAFWANDGYIIVFAGQ